MINIIVAKNQSGNSHLYRNVREEWRDTILREAPSFINNVNTKLEACKGRGSVRVYDLTNWNFLLSSAFDVIDAPYKYDVVDKCIVVSSFMSLHLLSEYFRFKFDSLNDGFKGYNEGDGIRIFFPKRFLSDNDFKPFNIGDMPVCGSIVDEEFVTFKPDHRWMEIIHTLSYKELYYWQFDKTDIRGEPYLHDMAIAHALKSYGKSIIKRVDNDYRMPDTDTFSKLIRGDI